jgi:cysteinyl-tRNA synthetase
VWIASSVTPSVAPRAARTRTARSHFPLGCISLKGSTIYHPEPVALELYDTLTRQKRPFVPREKNKVRMYVCGVTVYDYCHMGHARSAIAFDVLARWLRHSGYDVTFVKNFTDVDDKIIQRANERGVPPEQISEQYIEAYREDLGRLGLAKVDVEPKATEHIDKMIEVIERLVKKGLAYVVDGDVYFDVQKYEPYLKLSRRKLEDLRADRIEPDPRKHHFADFALWKSAKPDEPSWRSPWGMGRPGWHIECSAMAREYLGQPMDIHGGGFDLIFPHHENEIAQSEGAFGEELSRFWIHNGFLNINSEKMSKSLGNFFTIRDVLDRGFPGEAVRVFFLGAHYRSPLDFTDGAIQSALDSLHRLYAAVAAADEALKTHPDRTLTIGEATGPDNEKAKKLSSEAHARFTAAMDDDLNTSAASAVLFDIARAINALTSKPAMNSGEHDLLVKLRYELLQHSGILGLLYEPAAQWLARHRTANAQLGTAEIEAKIAERAAAKKAKDFKKADGIRDWLLEKGIVLEDSKGTTTWRVNSG